MYYGVGPDGVDDGEHGAVHGQQEQGEQSFLPRLAGSLEENVSLYILSPTYHIYSIYKSPTTPHHRYLI